VRFKQVQLAHPRTVQRRRPAPRPV
jgi:hypothetical protein